MKWPVQGTAMGNGHLLNPSCFSEVDGFELNTVPQAGVSPYALHRILNTGPHSFSARICLALVQTPRVAPTTSRVAISVRACLRYVAVFI